jgi:hypothetical protein
VRLAAALLAVALAPAAARADQVFLREADAPAALFGEGVRAARSTLALSPAELAALSQRVGRRVDQREYPVLTVSSASGQLLGWIFVLDVVGQTLPITFAVGVKADGRVQDLQVMVYREPHGSEIRERRFRAQFAGKRLEDPILVGKDVDAITGATISSHSATYAVRKALALAEILRGRGGKTP